MSRIFLSHSSANNSEAVALCQWLAEQGWKDVFLDLDAERGIKAGELWEEALRKAADRCEAVLFLISRAWLASEWCRDEFRLARHLRKRLFGILIEDMPVNELPVMMTREWQFVNISAVGAHKTISINSSQTCQELAVCFNIEGLRRLKLGLLAAGLDARYFAWPPQNDPDRPPYRGLLPLEAEDAGIFFGRDAQIADGLNRLRGLRDSGPPRLMIVLGASGSGKSSFLRAGLLPRLARDDQNFLPLPILRPARAAISGETGLIRSLETVLEMNGLKHVRAEIRAAIAGGAECLQLHLAKLVEHVQTATIRFDSNTRAPVLVIPIDQGEELFLAEGSDESAKLIGVLRNLLLNDSPQVLVLVTMRSDTYERLQTEKSLEGIRQETLSLPPMPRGAYQEVIEGPAERLQDTTRALQIDPALTQAILADIESGAGRDALPLLAFTIERLYLEYGGRGRLTIADYEALGRIKGSIEVAVHRAMVAADNNPKIPPDHSSRLQLLRRGLIPWLAGIDPETGTPRRRVARWSEIPADARPLIQCLVEQRLLATDVAESSGEVIIEPAHEALLRQWSLLQGWLTEDAGLLVLLEGVKRASKDWLANEKDPAWLTHSTGRLAAAERLHKRPDLSANLTQTEWNYLAACRQREDTSIAEAQAAQTRKRRLELALIAVLLFTSCAGIIYAVLTNYDFLKIRGEMLADELWPTRLSADTERSYAQMKLMAGEIISFRECSMCPFMIVIPAGSIDIGSPLEEKGRESNEGPRHNITILNNFAVGKFEVTFEEWDACVKAHVCANAWDQGWGRGDRPVINVSWIEAQQYVRWLSERAGKVGSYRLLSEAEWEYAARAGNSTAYYYGNDDTLLGQYAWFGENSDEKSKSVGGKLPNAFGLYDMHGNVWEWVEDCYHKDYLGAPFDGSAWTTSCEQNSRVLRSGSWYHPTQRLRSAFRNKYQSDYHDDGVGLRVARTLSIRQ